MNAEKTEKRLPIKGWVVQTCYVLQVGERIGAAVGCSGQQLPTDVRWSAAGPGRAGPGRSSSAEERGLLHDAEELLLVHLAVAIAVRLCRVGRGSGGRSESQPGRGTGHAEAHPTPIPICFLPRPQLRLELESFYGTPQLPNRHLPRTHPTPTHAPPPDPPTLGLN